MNKNSFNNRLEDRQLLLEEIIQSSPLAYLVIDNLTDKVLLVNDRFSYMWGIEDSVDEIICDTLRQNDIIPDNLSNGKHVEAYVPTRDDDSMVINEKIIFRNDTVISRTSREICNVSGDYMGTLYTFIDITEKHKEQVELEKYKSELEVVIDEKVKELQSINAELRQEVSSKEDALRELQKYSIITDNARDIILIMSPEGKIIDANEAAVKS